MIQTIAATYCALLFKSVIKVIGKGKGEAAPGLLALKIDPLYISRRQENIPIRILVSGTNGKTTTTHMIGKVLTELGKEVITNSHGSNLSRGIASALLNLKKCDVSLWETDEAAFVDIFKHTQPTHVLLLNIFRDQLDRYGEVDTTAKKWLNVLKSTKPLTLIINADDPNLEYLAQQCSQHKIIRLGFQSTNIVGKTIPDEHGDAIFCPVCQKPLKYNFVSFSHMGDYYCTCEFKRGILDVAIDQNKNGLITANCDTYKTSLRGSYSAYNIGAVISISQNLGLETSKIKTSIENFKPSFGRQEELEIQGKTVHILLIKNPTGANENITIVSNEPSPLSLVIAINDNFADGRDISWLWDVAFEKLGKKHIKIIVTGTRALDMAVRLKYADIEMNHIIIEQDIAVAMKKAQQSSEQLIYILPTYTAMLKIRKLLISKT